MATGAKGGYKTLVKRGDGATPTENFVAVAELLDITGPNMTKMIEDATTMDSPNGAVEKISLGLRDAGEVTFQVHLLDENTSHNLLLADFWVDTFGNFQIVPNGATKAVQFAAHVAEFGSSYPVKGKMVRDIKLVITGKPVKV